MYWSPNFLAVVFKKQEISQQVVTRMQQTSFHKFSGGDTPGPSQLQEGATPSRTNTQPGLQAPRCWDPDLGPLNFSAVVAHLLF